MPLGQGYTVEEQIDTESEVGGIQIEAIPMKKDVYEDLKARRRAEPPLRISSDFMMSCASYDDFEMGLGMGGSMHQEIYEDEYGLDAWDIENRQRCFVMLANADQWMKITGEEPPLPPLSAEDYSKAGLPWFEYYDGDRKAIEGAKALGSIKSIKEIGNTKREPIWPDEKSNFDYNVQVIKGANVSDGSW